MDSKQNTSIQKNSGSKEISVKVYFDSKETATKKGAHAIGCRN